MAANQAQSTSKALVRPRMIRPTTITIHTTTIARRPTPTSILCDHGRHGPSGTGTRQTLQGLPGIFSTHYGELIVDPPDPLGLEGCLASSTTFGPEVHCTSQGHNTLVD